jgi:hypothetical protein
MAMRTSILLVAAMEAVAASAQTPPPIEWQHRYGGSGNELPRSISRTSDGGYIACSNTQSSDGAVTGYHGGADIWLVKMDADGTLEWERCYGGSGDEMAKCAALEAPDGGYILAGRTYSTDGDVSCPVTAGRLWVARIDINGDVLWDLCPAGPAVNSFGGIAPAHDGGWIICGSTWTDGGSGCGQGLTDLWLGHVSDAGQLLWSRCYGGSQADGASSIMATSDGAYLVTGSTRSNDGDLTGINPYWNGPPPPQTPHATGWVMKVDAVGDIIWQYCYGGSSNDELIAAAETTDGKFWVTGNTSSTDGDLAGNHGDFDGWVVLLDQNGELLGQRCIGGSAQERMFGVIALSNGQALVTGDTFSTDGDVTETHGSADAWVVVVTLGLDVAWQRSLGGALSDAWVTAIGTVDDGVALICSTRSNDGDLIDLPGHGEGDLWVLKLAPWSGTGVEDQADENGILLFPNPTTGDVQLDFGALHGPGWQLEIMDALGRVVLTMSQVHATRGRLTIGTHGLSQGSYAVRLHRNGESHGRRFVKH